MMTKKTLPWIILIILQLIATACSETANDCTNCGSSDMCEEDFNSLSETEKGELTWLDAKSNCASFQSIYGDCAVYESQMLCKEEYELLPDSTKLGVEWSEAKINFSKFGKTHDECIETCNEAQVCYSEFTQSQKEKEQTEVIININDWTEYKKFASDYCKTQKCHELVADFYSKMILFGDSLTEATCIPCMEARQQLLDSCEKMSNEERKIIEDFNFNCSDMNNIEK